MISYGGIELLNPGPDLVGLIESRISLSDVFEAHHPSWPGFLQSHLPFPGYRPTDPIELNSFRWPVSASRWAYFHGLVDGDSLTRIRNKAVRGNTNVALPFVLKNSIDGVTTTNESRVRTNLWMLPARPLFQTELHIENCYLITLVDDRFWWWQRSELVTITGETTWETLYSAIAEGLGIDLSVDTIPAAYKSPTQDLRGLRQPLPALLDAVAFSVGQRIVRKFDGKVVAQSATSARSVAKASAQWTKYAGGEFQYGTDQDLNLLVPDRVCVVFPVSTAGVTSREDVHESIQELKYLSIPEYGGTLSGAPVPDSSGGGEFDPEFFDSEFFPTGYTVDRRKAKVLRSTALAYIEDDPDVPVNDTEIEALSQQWATDWYRWQLGFLDMTVRGIFAWMPEGLHDLIWRHRADNCSTRIIRQPFYDCQDQGFHLGDNGTLLIGWGGDGVFHSVTDHGDWITVPGENQTISTDTPDLDLGPHATVRLTPTSDITIQGIVSGVDGRRVRIWNVDDTATITLAHEDAAASAFDRLICAGGSNLAIGPNGTAEIEWHDADKRWRVSTGAGNTTITATPDWGEVQITSNSTPPYYSWTRIYAPSGSSLPASGTQKENPTQDILGKKPFEINDKRIVHKGPYRSPTFTAIQDFGPSENEIWRLFTSNLTAGNFTLTYHNAGSNASYTTRAIGFDADDTEFQTAILDVPEINTANVTRTTESFANNYTLSLNKIDSNVTTWTANFANATGSTVWLADGFNNQTSSGGVSDNTTKWIEIQLGASNANAPIYPWSLVFPLGSLPYYSGNLTINRAVDIANGPPLRPFSYARAMRGPYSEPSVSFTFVASSGLNFTYNLSLQNAVLGDYTITATDVPGSFSDTTAAIPYDDDGTGIEAALAGLPEVANATVTFGGGIFPNTWFFANITTASANTTTFSANTSGLVGNTDWLIERPPYPLGNFTLPGVVASNTSYQVLGRGPKVFVNGIYFVETDGTDPQSYAGVPLEVAGPWDPTNAGPQFGASRYGFLQQDIRTSLQHEDGTPYGTGNGTGLQISGTVFIYDGDMIGGVSGSGGILVGLGAHYYAVTSSGDGSIIWPGGFDTDAIGNKFVNGLFIRKNDPGSVPAAGTILVSNGTAWVQLDPGTDGQVLTANSTTPTGLKWV